METERLYLRLVRTLSTTKLLFLLKYFWDCFSPFHSLWYRFPWLDISSEYYRYYTITSHTSMAGRVTLYSVILAALGTSNVQLYEYSHAPSNDTRVSSIHIMCDWETKNQKKCGDFFSSKNNFCFDSFLQQVLSRHRLATWRHSPDCTSGVTV